MVKIGWQVHHVPAELLEPASPLPCVGDLPGGWSEWLRDADVVPGTPFLLSPTFEYDGALNEFFQSVAMVGSSPNTQTGYARDLAAFLNFLWTSRNQRPWRDATEADHVAYLVWRRRDPEGPRVDAATWDREVAAVNRFYKWQGKAGNVRTNPIPQRSCRFPPVEAGRGRRGGVFGETAATTSHGAAREKIEWLSAASYRLWRDVGMRGYTPAGLPDPAFRGRWAARNGSFCDLMVRTGLRLSEQAALTVFEVPVDRGLGGIGGSGFPLLPPKAAQRGGCTSPLP